MKNLNLPRSLAIAADNLDLIGENGALVVQLEIDILDQECPDFVTESVGIQVSLSSKHEMSAGAHFPDQVLISPFPGIDSIDQSYLERKFHLHFIRQHLRDNTIESRKNLHGELRLDPAFVDQVIERIGKGQADTATETHIQLVTFAHTPQDGTCQPDTQARARGESTCSHGRARSKPARSW